VSSFWDDGFYSWGDETNGYRAEGRCNTSADVEEWLHAVVRVHYPDSAYARGHADR
jgi:disulfide oxidoreductase YuzD